MRPETHGFRPRTAVCGAMLCVVALSGLLDDTGVWPHPWWLAAVFLVAGFCGLAVWPTVMALLSDEPDRSEAPASGPDESTVG